MNHTLLGAVAPWGQAAAIILACYLFISMLLNLVLAAALMFGFSWVREKAELIKRIRPLVNQLNEALTASQRGETLPQGIADNKIISVVSRVPGMVDGLSARAGTIEEKVEQGSNRVANVAIEVRARSEMVKAMARAFFLPGRRRKSPIFPEYATLVERAPSEVAEGRDAGDVERREEERPLEQEIVITQSAR
ncbi:MAG TPA: hypothetical protein VKV19_12920 [Ktedonobacteraceae bacterium]|jgi:hypothetical protein|nr:hypothetical protein [Ktedonobacteraceae bacterium]